MLIYSIILVFTSVVLLVLLIVLGKRSAPKSFEDLINPVLQANFFQLPALSYVKNRQGRLIAFRHYLVGDTQKVAVLIHGSAMDSKSMHGLARFLQANQIACVVPDMRGHGSTGTLGDIDYEGQLEDDLFDLVSVLKADYTRAEFNLIGFSAGGGFALRFAATQYGQSFQRAILLAPMLHHKELLRAQARNVWAKPFIGRLIGLTTLHLLGLRWWENLPVVAFGVPDPAFSNVKNTVSFVPTYSYRLQNNFRPRLNWRKQFKKLVVPTTVIVGSEDELFATERYDALISPLNERVQVRLLPNLGHAALCGDPLALQAILEAMNTSVSYLAAAKAESKRLINA